LISNTLKETVKKLLAYDQGASTELGGGYYAGNRDGTLSATFTAAEWGDIFSTGLPAEDTSIYGAAPESAQRQRALPALNDIFNQMDLGFRQIISLAESYETNYEQSLLQTHSVYRQILNAVKKTGATIPPSGVIAGVYATVDATR